MPTLINQIRGVRLPGKSSDRIYDISLQDGNITGITDHKPQEAPSSNSIDANGGLCTPSFCHAHVHLDKAFILADPKFSDLGIVKGDFAEAMELTGLAKARFEEDDLLRRGNRLIEESVQFGVTCMRAFVEVDEIVQMKCLDVMLKLKEQWQDKCFIQLCAFAQLALHTGQHAKSRRELLKEAVQRDEVDVVGCTPYVDDGESSESLTIEYVSSLASIHDKLLDFHFDYHLDPDAPSLLRVILEGFQSQRFGRSGQGVSQCITFGHCTRLTLATDEELEIVKRRTAGLNVSFIGLPTSDLFMVGRPSSDQASKGQRPRGTLQVVDLIQRHDFNCAIAMNNIGNAFTPLGSCNPLQLASLGVAVYQAGTKQAAELLYVSAKLIDLRFTAQLTFSRRRSQQEPVKR